ncbi:glycosyltransferase family 25 protein [Aspergillus sp. HF37]|nr:glycosyltransferase family 25 protein [Aspergillus sp. HF37]
MGSICSLAYAVSKRGARRLLYELGVNRFDSPFDIMLRDVCEGTNNRSRGVCLTVQPPLFNHHRPAGHSGFYNDISAHPDEMVEEPRTDMIRYSARLNILKLVLGMTNYDDQFPDKNA